MTLGVFAFGKAAMSCTVKYHNSKNKDDQFSWDQTTTIEELKIMIITAHANMADGFRLCYCGKEVEDIRRVAEYLMVQDPKPFIAVVKLRGGGKRARLPEISENDMKTKSSDLEEVKSAMSFSCTGFKKFTIGLDDLGPLKGLLKTYKSTPDKIPFYAAALTKEMVALEAHVFKMCFFTGSNDMFESCSTLCLRVVKPYV